MKRKLTALLHLDVQSFEIKKLDCVKDVMELQIVYQIADEETPQTEESGIPQQTTISPFPGRSATAVGE